MTTQFLSKVPRNERNDSSSQVGPGSYSHGSSLQKSLPAFAPFYSTTKRMANKDMDTSPAPGSYDISEDISKRPGVGSTFKSNTQRFNEITSDTTLPGPGSYVLKSSFKNSRPKQFRTSQLKDKLQEILPLQRCAPSIPTKFQAYGYEQGSDGQLELQDPVNPGYSGRHGDAVGPCDYNPNSNIKFKSVPKPNFAKGSQRDSLDKITAKNSDVPGPGYYNSHSEFDLPETGGASYNDTDFLMQLNAARKRQSAVFESRTQRDSMLRAATKRRNEPGPGQYNLPPSIKTVTKPANKQFFASSGARFEDPQPRSMRISSAPVSYNAVTSDFDQIRLKILKHKKMVSRSGWAQNIAFTSTESRFNADVLDNEVPPSSQYFPKTGMADTAPKPNIRAGAFGSKDQRFKEEKPAVVLSREQLVAAELNRDITGFLSKPHNSMVRSSHDSSGSPTHSRPKYTSNFAPSTEERNRPVKTPPGPPPGAYNLQPTWTKSTAVVMAPSTVVSKKVYDSTPGPGEYNISRRIGNNSWKNPKNIMLTTTERNEKVRESGPGPQAYNPMPLSGSLLRPTHNVLLSDSYYN